MEYEVAQEAVRDLPPPEPPELPELPEPILYEVLHVYGGEAKAYLFRSYNVYGGWYGYSYEPIKEVLEYLGIDLKPEDTLNISPVDEAGIKFI